MDGAACTINALPAPVYDGSGDFYYGRKGHIPAVSRFHFPTCAREYFLPADELQKLLSAQNMLNESRTLIYCGGGMRPLWTASPACYSVSKM